MIKNYNKDTVAARALRMMGGISIAGGAVMIVAGATQHHEAAAIVIGGIGVLFSAAFYFSLAHIQTATERTAYYTEQIAMMLAGEKGTEGSVKPEPNLAAVFDAIIEADEPTKPKIVGERFYVQQPGGEQAGAYSLGELRTMKKAGAISASTPVFRDGDQAWATAGDFLN